MILFLKKIEPKGADCDDSSLSQSSRKSKEVRMSFACLALV